MRRTYFLVLLVLVVFLLGGQSDNALSAPKNVIVNDVTSSGQHLPSIALGPNNYIYIVWVDCRNDATCEANTDIYFARSIEAARVLILPFS